MFIRMGITYDSDKALEVADNICKIMRDTTQETSVQIAKEKGPFPNFDWKGYSQSKFVSELGDELQGKIS